MSALGAVLDRLNDIEATIVQLGRDAGQRPSVALRLSLKSLESRRDMLRDELSEIAQQEFVDVCDYRIVPDSRNAYALASITSAWHDFQEAIIQLQRPEFPARWQKWFRPIL